jgi:hypothetical protein
MFRFSGNICAKLNINGTTHRAARTAGNWRTARRLPPLQPEGESAGAVPNNQCGGECSTDGSPLIESLVGEPHFSLPAKDKEFFPEPTKFIAVVRLSLVRAADKPFQKPIWGVFCFADR